MMSAHNCQAPSVIVASCEGIKTGQSESCFRCRVEATAKTAPKFQRLFSRCNISIPYLSILSSFMHFCSQCTPYVVALVYQMEQALIVKMLVLRRTSLGRA